mgnify:CR=1 FL=1|tara:strand:+ start:15167 stop:15985 length:819 start_codon:yes stop_codon:yes gene_type:complete
MNPFHGRKVFLFDVETTGVDSGVDQIIEISFIAINGNKKLVKTERFKPSVPISPGAQDVHGISAEDLKNCPSFHSAAAYYHKLMTNCDVICGYNVDFDIKMIVAEFKRSRLDSPIDKQAIIDPFHLWRAMSPRTLVGAAKHFLGIDLEDAHSAEADINATEDILYKMLETWDLGEKTPEELTNIAFPERRFWIGPSGHFIWNDDGKIVLNFSTKHKGTILDAKIDEEVSGFLHWCISKDFDPHIKSIAKKYCYGIGTFYEDVVAEFGKSPTI